jgi:hypothetical protein
MIEATLCKVADTAWSERQRVMAPWRGSSEGRSSDERAAMPGTGPRPAPGGNRGEDRYSAFRREA